MTTASPSIQIRSGDSQATAGQALAGRLAALLQMEERLRQAEKKELPFIAVNETHLLVPYRQAALWRASGPDRVAPLAVSGLAVLDADSPYLQWLGRLCRHLKQTWDDPATPAASLPFAAASLPPALQTDWADWLPAHGLFVPLPLWPPAASSSDPAAKPPLFGALTLFSQQPFSPADLRIMHHLAGAYGQALSLAFVPRRASFSLSRRTLFAAAALCAVLLFPLRQSVLAPAEVIAQDPWPVRSPLDGVVERILVEPNAGVKQGDVLLKLDTTELATRLAVAVKSLEIARVELRQARQQALNDREAKLRLTYLNGRVEQLEAEKSYVESLLERAAIQSPINGVALVDAPEEWAGKPVTLGQRIMTVAEPSRVRLEILLPMDEYLPQASGDTVLFFPNVSPGSPLTARIYQVGFHAQETPQAGQAFRLRADFESGGSDPRLGVRGSAKLYGSRAPLVYALLRKPFMKLRQWLGI